MEDRERIERFVKRYASRLQQWAALGGEGSVPGGSPQSSGQPAGGHARARLTDPDPRQAAAVLFALLDDLISAAEEPTAELRRLRELAVADALAPAKLLRAIIDRDSGQVQELAVQWSVETQALEFLGAYLARPFLVRLSIRAGAEPLRAKSTTAVCPLCEHEAVLSLLLPDGGQRQLWCRYCASGWAVRRLACPFCGNTESAELGYFRLEGQTGRRVDFCRRCRRYLKTVDLRELGAENTQWRNDFEDLITGDLDLVAVKEGFLPPGTPAIASAGPAAASRGAISDGGAL